MSRTGFDRCGVGEIGPQSRKWGLAATDVGLRNTGYQYDDHLYFAQLRRDRPYTVDRLAHAGVDGS